MSLFAPNHTFLCYRDVSAEFLREQGIDALLLDIDNTLAPYEQPTPDPKICAWLQSLADAGVRVAFLSNNHAERVELFNKDLGLPMRYDAYKPLPRQAKRMLKRLGVKRRRAALMGDQIFTDVLCAHLAGMRAFLVPPIVDRTDRGTRFKRYLERGILRRYHKRNPDAPSKVFGRKAPISGLFSLSGAAPIILV